MPIDTSPKEGIGQFFDAIFGSESGFVYSPCKGPIKWDAAFFKWPQGKDRLVEHVMLSAGQGKDVYYSPVIWEKPRVAKECIKGTHVFWADFDSSCPEDWTLPGSEAVSMALEAVPGPPSLDVQSSKEHKHHVYWKVDELVTDISAIENINRSIAYVYGADTSGWDATQILRVPFTSNFKYDPPLPVIVERFDPEISYTAGQFKHFKPVKELVYDTIEYENLPEPATVLSRYRIPTDATDLFSKQVIPEGSRSSAMMRSAHYCMEIGFTDSEAYAVLLWLDDKWGKFKTRSDRKRRLSDLVNKARQVHPHPLETFQGLATVSDVEVVTKSVVGFWDFVQEDVNVEWVVENLIPAQGLMLVTAEPGVGKS